MTTTPLILASGSPRRRELLNQIGVRFETASADIDESVVAGEYPAQYVNRLALQKAQAVACAYPGALVLGSDTAVVCDQQILGKPIDKADAISMLQLLSGRRHQVMTSVALVQGAELTCLAEKTTSDVERHWSIQVTTDVTFKALALAECERYWDSGEPQDKAGSYGIQGLAAVFVERIEGSYSSVVGLPLQQTAVLLQQHGVDIWQCD